MKRKKRKLFESPEEREEWEIRSQATDRMLRERMAKIEAELHEKDPNYRGLGYWIAQVRADRDAGRPWKRTRLTETPEQREEREIRSEALDRMLRNRLERIEAELVARDPNYRGVGYWIAQVRAEREAGNAA